MSSWSVVLSTLVAPRSAVFCSLRVSVYGACLEMSFEANVECRPVFLGDVVMVVRVCVVEKIQCSYPARNTFMGHMRMARGVNVSGVARPHVHVHVVMTSREGAESETV